MTPSDIDKNLFYQHTECKFFPCHEGLDIERFNCMLCYCPLYLLGEKCGGNFVYTKKGIKNCTPCTIPHDGDSGVKMVKTRFGELAELVRKREDAELSQEQNDQGQEQGD